MSTRQSRIVSILISLLFLSGILVLFYRSKNHSSNDDITSRITRKYAKPPGTESASGINNTQTNSSSKKTVQSIKLKYPVLPNPKPFLESKGTARQDPVLQVNDFSYQPYGAKKSNLFEQPEFVVGNKAVVVRKIDGRNRPDQDKCVTIYINNKQVGKFMWWGSFKDGGYGYPFKDIKDDPESLKINKKAETVVYSKPYFTPAGKKAVFTYTLKALKDSKIKLSWDMGISQQELEKAQKDFAVSLWFSTKNYRGKQILIDRKIFKQTSRKKLVKLKRINIATSGDFVFNALNPLKGYALKLDDLRGNITESLAVPKVGDDRYSLIYRTHYSKRQAKGQIIIDLGKASLPQDNTPPSVGGIDFWQVDGTHVPLSPTRNVMPNPSFEQGLRYWKWVGGGAIYKPSKLLRYAVVPQGRFGKNALIIRDTQRGAPPIMSFPISLEKGQVYTLSFYAKADAKYVLKVSLASVARGGKFAGRNGPWGDTWNPDSKFPITTRWTRYSRTFVADAAGVKVQIYAAHNTLIDGIQIEKGEKATSFVAPPFDGNLTTTDPDNDLETGKPINAELTVTGKPGTVGKVRITAENIYRETVYSGEFDIRIGQNGTKNVSLPFDSKKFGEGIFVVKVKYSVKGFRPYFDYYRLSIMKPLHNTHATKNVFGTLGHYARITRGEDLAKKYEEWGFGSTSWGYSKGNAQLRPYLEKKYRIANIATMITSQDRGIGQHYRSWKAVTPKMEKRIEQVAYESAKLRDPEQYNIWAFGNEEEGAGLIREKKFDEYFKAQLATAIGVKRAMPKAKILPTCGTSGYSRLRGYDAIEGYLKAARKHHFKYDGIAVHPYGNIDKGTLSDYDLDEETARLIKQMKKYGYGKETPIYYTEMFNIPDTYIPSWGADKSYDAYQSGKPTYDFGNREFIQAASIARAYIIILKYWPQVQSANVWISQPFMDMRLTPIIVCKVVNTLGHLMGYVKYQADIKPAAGIRGYAFKLKDGTGIAPIWCVNNDVENGLTRGPVINVKFHQAVEFYDLMGNRRSARTDKDRITKVQLTPAPLFIKAANVKLLAQDLQNAESNDSSAAITLAVNPTIDGKIVVSVKNLTGREQSGKVSVMEQNIKYNVKPNGKQNIVIPGAGQGNKTGEMYKWDSSLTIKPDKGKGVEKKWDMDYFYVPRTNGQPDWSKIPSIPILNRYVSSYKVKKNGVVSLLTPKAGYPGDLKADFKMAWDKNNLYLRVEAKDDKFLTFPELWKKGNSYKMLYAHDACLEVYFDCGANGRTNLTKTYDNDDYRYDFSIGKSGKSGKGMVYRLREVYHQLADGVNMATKDEAARKIKCNFKRTTNGYVYTITFGQRYLEPIVLKKGFMAGFALFLHDRDDENVPPGVKGLSLATEPGSACDYKPYFWPLMILAE